MSCFNTQKQHHINTVSAVKPVSLRHEYSDCSRLVDDLASWIVQSSIFNSDELFTICNGPRKKVLLKRDVATALKDIANDTGVNSRRISAHSLRRWYATVMQMNEVLNCEARSRARWEVNSTIPNLHDAMPTSHSGGLSCSLHLWHTWSTLWVATVLDLGRHQEYSFKKIPIFLIDFLGWYIRMHQRMPPLEISIWEIFLS